MDFRRIVALAAVAASLPLAAAAQQISPQQKAPQAPQQFNQLKAYESCSFPDGLAITDIQRMPEEIHDRPVQTKSGQKTVPLLAGRRITFAYPGAEPFASVKLELLPPENYTVNKALLLQDFDDIVASDKSVAKNTTRPPRLSAFSMVGLDRKELAGNTLGIYMLMDDTTHTVATVYLLNPKQSHFKTIQDYSSHRDAFLYNYTRCIRNNQSGILFGVH